LVGAPTLLGSHHNHKWFRNLTVLRIMADKLEKRGMAFPNPTVDLAEIRCKYHAATAEERELKE
jgi:hypothetical protein